MKKHTDLSAENTIPELIHTPEGLSLTGNGQTLHADFTRLLPRIRHCNLSHELLIKASKIKDTDSGLTAIDATAGLGEDSFLLAAAGFSVKLYERDHVIAALLQDALERASAIPELTQVVSRMELIEADSIKEMPLVTCSPDVILLDPMFPERQKSALIKKKFQLLQQLEIPCDDEMALLNAALAAHPRRIIIKRPLKGPSLADKKPDYSLEGTSIRYDCILPKQAL